MFVSASATHPLRISLPTGAGVPSRAASLDPTRFRNAEAGRGSGVDQEAASSAASLCTPPSEAASPPYSRSSALGAKCCL